MSIYRPPSPDDVPEVTKTVSKTVTRTRKKPVVSSLAKSTVPPTKSTVPPTKQTGKTISAESRTNLEEDTAGDILRRTSKVWNGNNKKIAELSELTYKKNGSSFIISIRRKDVLLEIIGMLREQPYDDVLTFLQSAESPNDVLWKQKAMDVGRQAVDREVAIQRLTEVGTKGTGKCRKCSSTELVYAAPMQMASGDEGSANFVRCVMCGNKWRA